MTGAIIAISIAFVIWQCMKYYRDKQAEESEGSTKAAAEATEENVKQKSTKDIVLQSLKELQCEPVVKEDDEEEGSCEINFEYQSENFVIRTNNSLFVNLYDAYWYAFESKDTDQLSNVKRIINSLNWRRTVNNVYSIDEGMCNVHTRASMLCVEEGFTDYLRVVLRECFTVHNDFFRLMAEG